MLELHFATSFHPWDSLESLSVTRRRWRGAGARVRPYLCRVGRGWEPPPCPCPAGPARGRAGCCHCWWDKEPASAALAPGGRRTQRAPDRPARPARCSSLQVRSIISKKKKKRKEKAQVRCLPTARCKITGARRTGEGSWCREAWRARSGSWWDVTSPEAESSVPCVAQSPAPTLGQHRVQ